jgi:phosphatidylglycerol---prolipoprotein diacylglyceryl transferase
LYEALLEGPVLFAILNVFIQKPRPRMATSGLFMLFYGLFRFLVEFVRLPDAQIGYLAFGWVTMGQILTLPMMVIGIWWLWLAYHRQQAVSA